MSETREPTDEEIEAEVAKTEAEVLTEGRFNLSGEQLTWLRLGARATAYRLLSAHPLTPKDTET